jgi:hypothetical protein
MAKKKKAVQVVHDEWDTYVVDSDDGPLFVSFDVAAAREDLRSSLCHCARVMIPVKHPNRNGGPTGAESERLWAMEESLCATLTQHAVKCRLVGRLTHQGTREIVFQLDDWESFRPPVGLWMSEMTDYEIDVSEHEGWDFFDDCIRPTADVWLYLADQSVVENLREAGSALDKEHSLEFVFLGKRKGLSQAVEALTARGYEPLGEPDLDSGQIVMVKRMIPETQGIHAESLANAELAQSLNISYDGWGCAVVE